MRWTRLALADLRAIDAWLTSGASKEQAIVTLGEIRRRADVLRDFPRGGRPMLRHDFRVLRVFATPYLILYRIHDDEIEILRIRHERQDWQAGR